MDIPVDAGPWLVLGGVLGIVLGVLLAGLVVLGVAAPRSRRPPRGRPAASPVPDGSDDDLPAFLESPPGTRPAVVAPAGWAELSAPAPPVAAPVPDPGRRATTGVLTAMALTALLLIGAAAAVATAGGRERSAGAAGQGFRATAQPGAVSARLTFEGVVLERYAVGVAVAYPRVEVSSHGGTTTARLELPTYNCLRDDAPPDPAAGGCTAAVPEYAELSAPGLRVETRNGELRLSGRFPTWREFNGSAPEPTGRAYELALTAAPRDGRNGRSTEPAAAVLRIGDDRAATVDDAPNEIRLG